MERYSLMQGFNSIMINIIGDMTKYRPISANMLVNIGISQNPNM